MWFRNELSSLAEVSLYVMQVCRQLSSRTRIELSSSSKAVYKPVWHTSVPLLSVQWMNSWWWTDELSETCRFSWQNKFVKLVHLFGFITKKYIKGVFSSLQLSLKLRYDIKSWVDFHSHSHVHRNLPLLFGLIVSWVITTQFVTHVTSSRKTYIFYNI